MQQRYYDPIAGRFLSIDPVVTDANMGGSFNRYAYANNSPFKYIDPDGRSALSAKACIGKCMGAFVEFIFKSGELAVGGNYGSGKGGGLTFDPRIDENGRANASEFCQGNGVVVNSYAKAGAEAGGLLGGVSYGVKGVAGTDLSTGKGFAIITDEPVSLRAEAR